MFEDGRSKSIVFVSHCILNQNAKMDGTAAYPGAIKEIIKATAESDLGIVQMPCPEFLCLGLTRGNPEATSIPIAQENTRIRRLMENKPSIDKIRMLARDVVFQLSDYQKYGFRVQGLIGVNRSPTCGVDTTSDNNQEIKGEGVFIRELRKELKEKGIVIRIIGIKAFEREDIIAKLRNLLGSQL